MPFQTSLFKALPVLTAALQGASNKVVVFSLGFFFRCKFAKVKYSKRSLSFCETSVNVVSFFKGQYIYIYFVPLVVIFSRTSQRKKQLLHFSDLDPCSNFPVFRGTEMELSGGSGASTGLYLAGLAQSLAKLRPSAPKNSLQKITGPKRIAMGTVFKVYLPYELIPKQPFISNRIHQTGIFTD